MQKIDSFNFLQKQSLKKKVARASLEKLGEVAYLGVTVNESRLYIPVSQIREIVPKPKITPIGHSKKWMLGLLKAQGEIYSVIDLPAFLDSHDNFNEKEAVVVLSSDKGHYAILVTAILGITKVRHPQQIKKGNYSVTYKAAEGTLIDVFSIQAIIDSTEMLNMSVF